MSAAGATTRDTACQSGITGSVPVERPFDLAPLSPMWVQPVRSTAGRSSHGVNAVVAPGDAGSGTLDAIVSNAGIFQSAVTKKAVANLAEAFPSLQYADAYRMAIPAVGRFQEGAAWQAVTVYGMDIGMYSLEEASAGAVVKPSSRARTQLSFSDAVTLTKTEGVDQLLLGSAPNGDDTLYLVTLASSSWSTELEATTWATGGVIDSINRDIAEIGAAAANSATRALPSVTRVTINVEAYLKVGSEDEVGPILAQLLKRHSYYSSRFPYDQIRFVVEFAFYENFSYWTRPDGQPWNRGNARAPGLPRSTLLDGIVRPLEAAQVPFIIRAGHAGAPYISPETAAAVAEAAPGTLVGFSTAEQHGGRPDPPRGSVSERWLQSLPQREEYLLGECCHLRCDRWRCRAQATLCRRRRSKC